MGLIRWLDRHIGQYWVGYYLIYVLCIGLFAHHIGKLYYTVTVERS
jgi:hypothetical protein